MGSQRFKGIPDSERLRSHMEGSGFEVFLVKTLTVDYSLESECAGKEKTKAE